MQDVYDDKRTDKPLVDQDDKPANTSSDGRSTAGKLRQSEETPLDSVGTKPLDEEEQAILDATAADLEEDEETPEDSSLYRDVGEPKAKRKFSLKKLSLKKKIAIVGFGSSAGLVILIILVVLAFFSSQKLLQLAEHITVYNMAQASRTLRQTESEVLEENVASETIDGTLYQTLKARFGETKLGQAIESFQKLRPGKVFNNLNANFEPTYTTTGTTVFGTPKKTLAGWSYTDADGKVTFIEKADSRFFRLGANSAERVRFAAELQATMEKDLQGYRSYVRNSVIKKVLADKGIKLRWWDKLGKNYEGLTQDAAARLAQRDTAAALSGEADSSCKVVSVCDATKQTEDATKKSIDDATKDPNGGGAQQVEDTVDDATRKELATAVEGTGVTKVLQNLSTIYAIAVPLCLIYDGSIENSKNSIDSNSTALEKEYFSVATAADQQKPGDTTAEAVGGFNDKLGNITNAIPEIRARGEAVDTSSYVNNLELPQSSASGSFSLLNVTLGDSAAIDVMNKILESGCGFMTDLKTGAVVALGEFALTLFTGGGAKAGEQAAKEGVDLAIQNLAKRILFTETRKLIEEKGITVAAKQTVGKFLIKTGVMVGATLGLTELAKMAVLKHMHAANTGLATDETFANQADMGGNLYSQDVGRNVLYGRPMTTPEVAQAKIDDLAYLSDLNSRKSIKDRYFALSDPSSLISRVGFSAYLFLSRPSNIGSRIFASLGNIFSAAAKSFAQFIPGQNNTVHALAVHGAGDYNIVRWGWSSDELKLIDDNQNEYGPMVNDLILDKSGRANDIENKFGKCFTETMGTLLSDGSIQRETDGAVIPDKGLCSPNNLGVNNNEFGSQMVFRWRLAKRNLAVKNHFLEIQNPTADTLTPVAVN